jgi:hypothetical protein
MKLEFKLLITFVILLTLVMVGFFTYRNYEFSKKINGSESTSKEGVRDDSSISTKKAQVVKDSQLIGELRDMLRYGEKKDAEKIMDEVIESGEITDLSLKYIQYFKLLNQLGTGINLEEKLEVIESLIKISSDGDFSKRDRAHALNTTAGLYMSDFNEATFKKIFEGTYSKYFVQDNKMKSIAKLAEYSYGIYPTSDALLLQNYWCNVVLLDKVAKTQSERESCLVFLTENLEKIEKQMHLDFDPRKVEKDQSYFSIVHRKAFVEAVVSLSSENAQTKDEYAKKFQADYLTVATAYGKHKSGTVDRLNTTVPYTYFYNAAFLNRVYGAKKMPEINKSIDSLVAFIQQEQAGSHYFKNFIKGQIQRPESDRDHNYYFIVELTKINKKFAELVKQINN